MSFEDNGARPTLTPREKEILGLVAKGLSAKQIASQIGIAPRTVEGHIDTVRLKFRARNKAHIIAQAVLTGALSLVPNSLNRRPDGTAALFDTEE